MRGCKHPSRSALLCPSCDAVVKGKAGLSRIAKGGRTVTCEECYFGRNLLCALALDEACTTFRPDTPEGLRPPRQLAFVFRQERRRQAAWAFPSAQEQAALHG